VCCCRRKSPEGYPTRCVVSYETPPGVLGGCESSHNYLLQRLNIVSLWGSSWEGSRLEARYLPLCGDSMQTITSPAPSGKTT
jgi:hypothetical protein